MYLYFKCWSEHVFVLVFINIFVFVYYPGRVVVVVKKLREVDQLCDGVGIKWKCDAVKMKRSRQQTYQQRVTAGLMEMVLYFLSSGL